MKRTNFLILRHLPLLFIWLVSFPVSAQNITLRGNVVDSKNFPLTEATVLLKGTTNGTVTDINGNYTLFDVLPTGEIEISYIGMIKQIIPINNRQLINVVLEDDTEILDEVVVTALGIKRKKKRSDMLCRRLKPTEWSNSVRKVSPTCYRERLPVYKSTNLPPAWEALLA